MVLWIVTGLNLALTLGLYGLLFIAARQVKRKKKTLSSVKQVSPKK